MHEHDIFRALTLGQHMRSSDLICQFVGKMRYVIPSRLRERGQTPEVISR
jgi:hypothetical protein